jgi:hypothetical protein
MHNFLDSGPKEASNSQNSHFGWIMRHQAASTASSLPSLMMPCPVCAGRMVYHGRRPIAADIEDTIYACRSCGAELIRTSVRKAANADAVRPAA